MTTKGSRPFLVENHTYPFNTPICGSKVHDVLQFLVPAYCFLQNPKSFSDRNCPPDENDDDIRIRIMGFFLALEFLIMQITAPDYHVPPGEEKTKDPDENENDNDAEKPRKKKKKNHGEEEEEAEESILEAIERTSSMGDPDSNEAEEDNEAGSSTDKQKKDTPSVKKKPMIWFCPNEKDPSIKLPRQRVFLSFIPKVHYPDNVAKMWNYSNFVGIGVTILLMDPNPEYDFSRSFAALIKENKWQKMKAAKQYQSKSGDDPSRGPKQEEAKYRTIKYRTPTGQSPVTTGFEQVTSLELFHSLVHRNVSCTPGYETVRSKRISNTENLSITQLARLMQLDIFTPENYKRQLIENGACQAALRFAIQYHGDETEDGIQAGEEFVYSFGIPVCTFEVKQQDLNSDFFNLVFPWAFIMEKNQELLINPLSETELATVVGPLVYRMSSMFNMDIIVRSVPTNIRVHEDEIVKLQHRFSRYIDTIRKMENMFEELTPEQRTELGVYRSNVHELLVGYIHNIIMAGDNISNSMREVGKWVARHYKSTCRPKFEWMEDIREEPVLVGEGPNAIYKNKVTDMSLSPYGCLRKHYTSTIGQFFMAKDFAYIIYELIGCGLAVFSKIHELRAHPVLNGPPGKGKTMIMECVVAAIPPGIVTTTDFSSASAWSADSVFQEGNHTIRMCDEAPREFHMENLSAADPKTHAKHGAQLTEMTSNTLSTQRTMMRVDPKTGEQSYPAITNMGEMIRVWIINTMAKLKNKALESRCRPIDVQNNCPSDGMTAIDSYHSGMTPEEAHNKKILCRTYHHIYASSLWINCMIAVGCMPMPDMSLVDFLQRLACRVLYRNNIRVNTRFGARVRAMCKTEMYKLAADMESSELSDKYELKFDPKTNLYVGVPKPFQVMHLLDFGKWMVPNEELAICAILGNLNEVLPRETANIIRIIFSVLCHLQPSLLAEMVQSVDAEEDMLTFCKNHKTDMGSDFIDENSYLTEPRFAENPNLHPELGIFHDDDEARNVAYYPYKYTDITLHDKNHANSTMIEISNGETVFVDLKGNITSQIVPRLSRLVLNEEQIPYISLQNTKYKNKVPRPPPVSFLTNQPFGAHHHTITDARPPKHGLKCANFLVHMEAKDNTIDYVLESKIDPNWVLIDPDMCTNIDRLADTINRYQGNYNDELEKLDIMAENIRAKRLKYFKAFQNSHNIKSKISLPDIPFMGHIHTKRQRMPRYDKDTITNVVKFLNESSLKVPRMDSIPDTAGEREIAAQMLPKNLQRERRLMEVFKTVNNKLYINIFALGFNVGRIQKLVLHEFQHKYTRQRLIITGQPESNESNEMGTFLMRPNPNHVLRLPNGHHVDAKKRKILYSGAIVTKPTVSMFAKPRDDAMDVDGRSTADAEEDLEFFACNKPVHNTKEIVIDRDIEEFFGIDFCRRNGYDPNLYLPANVERRMRELYNTKEFRHNLDQRLKQ
jgi:hypothetical protein